MALVGAIVFPQRFGQGAQVGQEPAQCLRAGDGHAWSKVAIEIEIHYLREARTSRNEVANGSRILIRLHAELCSFGQKIVWTPRMRF
jgi:hypothetical protein